MTHHRKAAVAAFGAYTALTLLMTWPLATGMTRDVPGDLGDSLLNMWILGWGAEQAPRVLTGQIALRDYWNANIFNPEPLALGFSEHLFGLVVQVLPVYWLTGNLILCYNLLFLSSFALSGLGMFLLVRELLHDDTRRQYATAVTLAAFIAGLVFAFLPFRIAQVAHIQSLQAQWMPLALYGFRRFIVTGRTHSLIGGASALLLQNWANGYYLIFFAPFVPIFVLHQMWASGQLRRLRLWLGFIGAAVAVVLGTMPFLMLYLETERAHTFTRPIGEVIRFSADVYSYLTAPDALGLWGERLQAFPKSEGELFFGFTPWVLAAIAIVTIFARSARPADAPVSPVPVRFSLPVTALIAIVAVQSAGLLAILFTGGFVTSVGGIPIRANNPMRILIGMAVAAAILLLISPGIRAHVRAAMRTPLVLSAGLACAALWLSLGPVPQAMGQPIPGLGVYRVLYDHVPGFDGLRVPARYAMIAAVFLCVVAGFGAKTLLAWRGPVARRWPVLATLTVAAAFLAEAAFAPMSVNLTWGDGAVIPPARVEAGQDAPAVYHTLARLPENAVVAEFPFGDPAWELRYVYYSTVHWKRLLNGYSGGFPHGYLARAARLQRIRENPDDAWRALREAGATHVIVHERAFPAGEAAVVTQWLSNRFAVEIARFDGDLLFDLTGVWPIRGQGPGPRPQ